jgi:pimeloyl-ACP methyl ester carboxylesterase
VNGIGLHYIRGGDGSPLILVHGFPQDWYEYHPIMPQLAKRFTVIAVDLRGAGGSTATPGGYMAEDVYQRVSALELERVYVVVHDIGGMVAYAFVRRYPLAMRGAMILDQVIPGIEGWTEVQCSPAVSHMQFMQVPDLPENFSQVAKLIALATSLASVNSRQAKWLTVYRLTRLQPSFVLHWRCTALFPITCNLIERSTVRMKCRCSWVQAPDRLLRS